MRRRRGLYSLVAVTVAVALAGVFLLSEAKLPITATLEPDGDKASAQGQRESAGNENTDTGLPAEREDRGGERQDAAPEADSGEEGTGEPATDPQSAGPPAENDAAGEPVTPLRYANHANRAVDREATTRVAGRLPVERPIERPVTGQRSTEQQYEQQYAAPDLRNPVAAGEFGVEREAVVDPPPAGQAMTREIEPPVQPPVRSQVPASTALALTVPGIGLQNSPVTDSISEGALANGAGKIPSTGFPWQPGANTYIAGHVYGYPGTGSWQLFAGLPSLVPGDQILLTDSAGTVYEYRVTEILRVAPTDVWVAQSTGQNMVSLQTCVGPGWSERLVVRAVMI